MNKIKKIIKDFGSLFHILEVPKNVYDEKATFESIKKDWESVLGPLDNWKK